MAVNAIKLLRCLQVLHNKPHLTLGFCNELKMHSIARS